ncbi:MAG TPA: hypothetical protein VOA87_04280 [Thermoanaerobaculia bacterium]|nr:hypothetical protein [Thermoanaerobaculia bacterium]
MNRRMLLAPLALLALVFSVALAVHAQAAKPHPTALIAIYHVAPGKHLDYLKWVAANDAIDKEAGVPPSVLYAHTQGDSWDYVSISPDLSKEQQAKVDAVAKQHGRKTGYAASLEFRTFITSHTDTYAIGPVSAADLVAAASQ